MGYFFSSLIPMRIIQVMKERLVGVPEGTETTGLVTWKGGTTLTAVLKNVLILDSRVSSLLGRLGLTVPGLSNFAVCRKSA
jgi:1-acyl-sn-glycerol-3-phosphate acyltransferase